MIAMSRFIMSSGETIAKPTSKRMNATLENCQPVSSPSGTAASKLEP